METPSAWMLSLLYWLHMLATVVWIGGLAAVSLLILPAARQALPAAERARLLEAVQRRLDPLGWLCLAVLAGTGLFQMSANPNYQGMLAIQNRWAAAIFIKHILFLGMTALSAWMTWGVLPGLRRAALRQAGGLPDAAGEMLRRQEERLLRLNLILSALILALTALARAS
jgi:uncharacterized membrane protein